MKLNRLEFEWDEEKAIANWKKHKVDFRDAVRVFSDPFRKELYDAAHSIDEDRYHTIGKVRDILFVVHTERANRVRIISARRATPKERRWYYDSHI